LPAQRFHGSRRPVAQNTLHNANTDAELTGDILLMPMPRFRSLRIAAKRF
jgi:hypothetical protein